MILIISLPSYGQSSLEFSAGANYPVIPYNDYFDLAEVDPKVSYTIETGFATPVYRNFYYSVGLNYNHLLAHFLGYESSASHQSVHEIDLTLGFISISVMPGYSFGEKKIVFISAGGYFSFLLNSSEKGKYETDVIDGTYRKGKYVVDARRDYKDYDFGLCAMAGARLKISDKVYFVPRAGYNLGLYKYNLVGSKIGEIRRGGFKSVVFLIGIDINLKAKN